MRLKATLLIVTVISVYDVFVSCLISKRSLIYPPPNGVVQTIVGIGLPLTIRQESIVIGIVIKASYKLPTNSTDITNPGVQYLRKRSTSRWNIYKLLNELLTLYGLGGKECVLRTICECASIPIDTTTSLISEILHAIFNPTVTNDEITEHTDNEYYAAYQIGLNEKINCHAAFPDCTNRFLDLFTNII